LPLLLRQTWKSPRTMSNATAPVTNVVPIVHGPMLIGTVFNVLLYGVSLVQTLFYISHYKRDKWFMKTLVLVIFIADTMNSVFDVEYIYDSLVIHYNDPAAIATANWVFATDPAMGSLIATMVQCFFAWRVKVLTGNYIITVLLVIGAIISGLGGVATSIAIGIVPNWLQFQKFEAPVIVWLVTSAVVDTTITFMLTMHLRKHRTGFQQTDDVLDRIVRLTVQTGLITSIWAIVDLIVFLTIPTGIHLIFNFPLSKLYSNSLLSSLNARQNWNFDGSTPGETSHISAPKKVIGTQSTQVHTGKQMFRFAPQVQPEVYVDVESHEMSDHQVIKMPSIGDSSDYDQKAVHV